jgi:hypothetical protein
MLFESTTPRKVKIMTKDQLKGKAKITKATVKAFIKDTNGLFLRVTSAFDGMTDACEVVDMDPEPVIPTSLNLRNTLGIHGAWFTEATQNGFRFFEDEKFYGISVYNCCGSFKLLRKK